MDDIRRWLEQHGLDRYAELLVDNDIDLDVVPDLTDDALKELGISIGGRLRLLKAARAYAASGVQPAASSDDASDATKVAERRQLTVLFADLVGSTELSQQLDPEDLREVNRDYQDAAKAAIERYGGYVARYMGDGVLAYFGYPTAHEDDAERAVCAGLALTDSVSRLRTDTELAARVGIATGPVVVGDLIGEGASQENAVVGETPNLAARLQSVANPANVAISDATHALVRNLFECVDLGTRPLKGFIDPQRLWCVRGEGRSESRFEALHGKLTPFIGRKSELGLLLERWEIAVAGEGQAVLLHGEAGIGKSRLADELRRAITTVPHAIVRYQCSPHHTHSALFPFAHQLQLAAGFVAQDDAEQRLDKLEAMHEQSTPDRDKTLWLLATLLSLPTERYPGLTLEPQALKSATIDAFRAQLATLCRSGPVLIVFEDVHWIDPTSLEALEALIDFAQHQPVLIIVTHRPEFASPWATHGFVTELRLNRMARRDGTAIIREVAGGKHLPEDITQRILTKAEGVALFVEELTKTVLETGLLREAANGFVLDGTHPELVIPATLRDSLMARLDRLRPVKEVAQIGACIGHEFSYELLRAVAGVAESELQQALEQLVDNQLLFRRGALPDSIFTFKHALVRDAAYDSLLFARRRALHAAILAALEDSHRDNLRAIVELLAHHAQCGELWEKAVTYGREAGVKAFTRSGNREAVNHFEQALQALGHLSDTRANTELAVDIRFELRNSLLQLGEFERAMTHLRDAETLAKKSDDHERLGWASVYMSNMHWLMGEYTDARAFAEAAMASAEKLTSSPIRTTASYYLGLASVAQGRYERAVDFLHDATRALQGGQARERLRLAGFPAAMARCFLAWALGEMGEFDQGIVEGRDGIEIAEDLDHPYSLIMTCWGLGHLYNTQGDFDRALPLLQRGLDLARERNIGILLPYAARPLGYALAMCGRVADGLALLEQAQAALEAIGISLFRALTVAQRAEATLLQSDRARAMSHAQTALALARSHGERGHEAYAMRLLGDVAAQGGPDDVETAERFYHEAMDLAAELGMRPLVAHCHYGLGALQQQTGQVHEANERNTAALKLYREIGMPLFAAKAESLL